MSITSSPSYEHCGKRGNNFLQGLKPIGFMRVTPGLKPRPPEEKHFSGRLLRWILVRELFWPGGARKRVRGWTGARCCLRGGIGDRRRSRLGKIRRL